MDNKVLKWNFIFQYGWVLTNILNSILLLPLYLRHIDPSTLGVWLATGSVLSWMMMVDPGIGEVMQQKIAESSGRMEFENIGKIIGSGFLASSGIFLLAVLFGYVCYYFVGMIINKNVADYPHLSEALVITILATGMTLISFTISGVNQGLHNTAPVAVGALTGNFLFLLINILLLYTGIGVMSIALANLARALFITLFNINSLLRHVKRQNIHITFIWKHFKEFIRIFSFTSASKIISGFSYSVDMLVLARFIPPAMITLYEINKRPINITSSLIGRHSVALMPLISHAKGKGEKQLIIDLIYRQFKFYCYAAILCAFLFFFNYKELITVWIGAGHYAGDTIIMLLIAIFFSSLICYYMAIVGYALGDIKMNSVYNIIRGIVFGTTMFFAAKAYGIPGALSGALVIVLAGDVYFYSYRLHKLGYLQFSLIRKLAAIFFILLPTSWMTAFVIKLLLNEFVSVDLTSARLIISGSLFVIFYLLLILALDADARQLIRQLTSKFFVKLSLRKS